MKDKLFFRGIYGDDSINMVRNIIHITPMELTGKRHNWYIKPHVHHDLFQIFLVDKGGVEFTINEIKHYVGARSFVTVPKNIVHALQMEENIKGWVISLHDTVLEYMLRLDADLILQLDTINVYTFDENDKHLQDTFATLEKCIYEFTHDLPAKEHALQYLVGMLLLRLYRISVTSSSIKISDTKGKIQFRRFLQLIKEKNSFKISVEEYAVLLQISSGHLNRICRENAGLSSKDVVMDYFIDSAKMMLSDFEIPISEVAYRLSIDDPGYFTRIFKKRTGLTPKEFRNQLIEK